MRFSSSGAVGGRSARGGRASIAPMVDARAAPRLRRAARTDRGRAGSRARSASCRLAAGRRVMSARDGRAVGIDRDGIDRGADVEFGRRAPGTTPAKISTQAAGKCANERLHGRASSGRASPPRHGTRRIQVYVRRRRQGGSRQTPWTIRDARPLIRGCEDEAVQNFSGFADCTCGSACTFASTSAGNSPSISISAMALPPGASRPTWKVAMLMPASPSVRGERADEARLVEIGDVDHRGAELRVHADALDVDDARPAVGEHRAGDRARLPLGLDRHGDQAFVVAVALARRLPRPRCRAPWRRSAPRPR